MASVNFTFSTRTCPIRPVSYTLAHLPIPLSFRLNHFYLATLVRSAVGRWLSEPKSGCRDGFCCQIQSYPHYPVLALVPRRFPVPAPFPVLLYSARLLRKTSGSESSRNCPVLVQRRLPTSPAVPHSPAGGRLRAQIGVGVVTDMPFQVSNVFPSICPHLRFR